MTLLAGFLDVMLRGVGLIALAAAVGGIAYALWGLRPLSPLSPLGVAAVRRALALVSTGAVVLAASRALLLLVIHPWALMDEHGRWPVREFLATDFGRGGLVSIVFAVGLAVAAFRLRSRVSWRRGWILAGVLAVLLLASGAWLAHALSRLNGREPLMAVTVLHQLGAALWIGGLIHLVGFRGLARGAGAGDPLGPQLLSRFSVLAFPAIGLVLVPGLVLSWAYIGDWGGVIGTGYGLMVLTKVALFLAALALGGLNFLFVRRWVRARAAGSARAVPVLIEAEAGIGITILLAASSLTSLPPAVDVVTDRATPTEVAARFVPKAPRLVSPPVGQLLAVAAPIDDTLSTRQAEEYAWSEYNHHVAGFFVSGMGLLALVDRTGRVPWARHWPLGLLGLAAFLFMRSDPRAWPLGPAGFWESMVLPDVLQHRLVVLIVVGLAVFEWLVRAGRLRRPGWRLVFPVLCAVGGALLLTHSHAMFNLKTEFLAEVSHAPMGILGVFMAWGRWIEIRLPGAARPGGAGDEFAPARRLVGFVWAIAMVLIGAILLFYRET
ncbi:MAG TPA: CopD family protein [Candidatus Limnocylindrales bacterium]|nr:CopD family protein [Candidatus Limnocylindrales bacterium]